MTTPTASGSSVRGGNPYGVYLDMHTLPPQSVDSDLALHTFANVAASQTDAVLVAAAAGQRIRVLAFAAVAASATPLTFNSKGAGAGVAISATFPNVGEVLPFNPAGWFETQKGEALTCTTGSGGTVGIQLVYCEA